jgi:hypothetical protein
MKKHAVTEKEIKALEEKAQAMEGGRWSLRVTVWRLLRHSNIKEIPITASVASKYRGVGPKALAGLVKLGIVERDAGKPLPERPKRACGTCEWAVRVASGDGPTFFHCHLVPPVVVYAPNFGERTEWPLVEDKEWCSRWQRRKGGA